MLCYVSACQKQLDLVIIIDTAIIKTGRPRVVSWYDTQVMVASFIRTLDVGHNRVHISLLSYNYDVHVEYYLTQYFTRAELTDSIATLREYETTQEGGGANLPAALRLVNDVVLTNPFGNRQNVLDCLLIITDENHSSDFSTVQSEIRMLKQRGVHVMVSGVGVIDGDLVLDDAASHPFSIHHISDGDDAERTGVNMAHYVSESLATTWCPEGMYKENTDIILLYPGN